MNIEAVFLDRDGTIGGNGHFIHPYDFEPYEFSVDAILQLKARKIMVFAFTNQHRISRGQATLEDFYREFEHLGLDDGFVCPHALGSGCDCQKPEPGMLLKAAKEYNLNLENCVVVGDLGTDMVAADIVGAKKILVRTGWGEGSLTDYKYLWHDVEADDICDNLKEAVQKIIALKEK